MRALRTEFTERWEGRAEEVRSDPASALSEMAQAAAEARLEDLLVVGKQSTGLIRELRPAAHIVQMLAHEAQQALAKAASLVS
jgi:nitronate monooxygenase